MEGLALRGRSSPADQKEGTGWGGAKAAKRTSFPGPPHGQGGAAAPQQVIHHLSDRVASLTFHGVLLYRPARFRKEAKREKKRAVNAGTKDRLHAGGWEVASRSSSPPRPGHKSPNNLEGPWGMRDQAVP